MNFDFSPDQKALRDQARKFLSEHASSTRVRRILDTETPYDAELWRGMAEMGWTGTAIPESYGGAGFGYLELCVLAEELGRSVAPAPFSSTIYLAAEALLLAGSEAQTTGPAIQDLSTAPMDGDLSELELPEPEENLRDM